MNPTGSTTEFIRRRIYHWKTTLSGIAGIAGPIAAILWPEYKDKIMTATVMLMGAGQVAAADSSNVNPKTEIMFKPPNITSALFLLFLLSAFCCLLCGCSSFNSQQTKIEPDGTRIESRQTVRTFFDGKSTVGKLRASTTDKTQGLTVGSISEETSGSNAVNVLKIIVTGAKEATPGP